MADAAANVQGSEARFESISRPGPFRALGPGMRNRVIVPPDDLRTQSPFVLLVEDFIEPQGDYHEHPHRGFETVSFFLEGEMENVDHTGHRSISAAGDVQWMTAGSGIFHGGKPVNGTTVHLLQLWLNLPAALRNVAPETREQKRATAVESSAPKVTARIYGERSVQAGAEGWSRYPITLTDVELAADGRYTLAIPAGERMLIYFLSGDVVAGNRTLLTGDVAWTSLDDRDQTLTLYARGASRLVAYSGLPIDEPSVVHGPFVMTDDSEIQKAYADLDAGRLLG